MRFAKGAGGAGRLCRGLVGSSLALTLISLGIKEVITCHGKCADHEYPD